MGTGEKVKSRKRYIKNIVKIIYKWSIEVIQYNLRYMGTFLDAVSPTILHYMWNSSNTTSRRNLKCPRPHFSYHMTEEHKVKSAAQGKPVRGKAETSISQ